MTLNAPKLVTRRRYFGVEAQHLRESAGRVLSRVQGVPVDRATVSLPTLMQEFGMSTALSRTMVDEMIEGGLLERLSPHGIEYAITGRFRQYAQAKIVEPLPRANAQLLLTHLADVAEHFNRNDVRNKYEIEALAVFGSYMSREYELSELLLGVTGRRRSLDDRQVAGRAMTPVEGTAQIRAMLVEQSPYVQVDFFHRRQDIPRPFSIVFSDLA